MHILWLILKYGGSFVAGCVVTFALFNRMLDNVTRELQARAEDMKEIILRELAKCSDLTDSERHRLTQSIRFIKFKYNCTQ